MILRNPRRYAGSTGNATAGSLGLVVDTSILTLDNVRTRIVAAINANRGRRGLPALILDSHLTAVSQEWADYLAATGTLVHGDFAARIQALYPGTEAAENIAEGYSASTLVTAWMCDRPHRDNILGSYAIVGIGVASSPNGDTFYVADFDAPRTAQVEP